MRLKITALAILFFLLVPVFSFAQKSRGRSSGGSVSVRSYTRKDGTHVSGYTRSSPGSRSSYSGSTDSSSSSSSEAELEGTPITPYADNHWIYEGVNNNPMNSRSYSKKKIAPKDKDNETGTGTVTGTISIEEQEKLLKGNSQNTSKSENTSTSKKKVLGTDDIEAYGLAPGIKAEAARSNSHRDNYSSSSYGSTSSRSYSSGSRSSSGTVTVRGYTRKDGTYVRAHTRSSPRR